VTGIFIGRLLQAIGGTAAWVVGFATLRDTIEAENIGKTFGLVNSFVGAGSLSGPAVAGILLELAGYWVTWGTVLIIIILDIIMRVVMIENPRKKRDQHRTPEGPAAEREEATENSALLPEFSQQPQDHAPSSLSFYCTILSQPRVIVGLLSYTTYSSLAASYNTTIPIHVRSSFSWGSLETGLIFAALQAPNLLLSPMCGWLRDQMGTRVPTAVGFILLAPLLWLLGAADQPQFPWSAHGRVMYIVAIIIIGCVQNLLASVGTIEITCEFSSLPFSLKPFIPLRYD
jgi:MFS family permease